MAKKTPELVAEALRLRAEGMSSYAVSKALGVSQPTVLRWTDQKHAEKARDHNRRHYEANGCYWREYYKTNRDKERARSSKWRKENPEMCRAQGSRYRQLVRGYKPLGDWERQRQDIYKACQEGEHTDHVYPISLGGLDHPWNLQNISAEENLFWNAKVKPNTSPLVELVPGGFVPLPDFLI